MSNGSPLDIWYFPVALIIGMYIPWFTQWVDTSLFFSKRSVWSGNTVYRLIINDLEIELWVHRYTDYKKPYFELHARHRD